MKDDNDEDAGRRSGRAEGQGGKEAAENVSLREVLLGGDGDA